MDIGLCPQVLRDFLFYLEIVRGHSKSTVNEYFISLNCFFKFIKKKFGLCDSNADEKDILVNDIDIDVIKRITLSDVYEYLYYVKEIKHNNPRTIARKVSCLRSFFGYLTNKANLLEHNPVENLETPSLPKTLPKYLSLEESAQLLESASESKRDYAIIVLFLNCGMRLSELVALNIKDVGADFVTIHGKGNKQRTVYLNDACKAALDDYIKNERPRDSLKDRDALFISRNKTRLGRRSVQNVVEKYITKSGYAAKGYTTHKLRHTAATLMHRYGNVDIRVLQEILGHENLGTTQIYTHVENEQIKNAAMANPLSKIKNKKAKEQAKD